ncbi:hypothetical protein DSECCO2_544460 [anaerobic digester metagenome]
MLGEHAERLFEPLFVGVAEEVDRVVFVPEVGEEVVQLLEDLRREVDQVDPVAFCVVGGEDGEPAGVRDHDRSLAAGVALREREHLRDLERAGQGVDGDNAGLAEGFHVDVVGSGERTRVGRGRCLAFRGGTGLDRHDGLGLRDLADHFHEGLAVLDLLDVEDDAFGLRVTLHEPEVVDEVEVGLVADRDDGGEPDVLLDAPVNHCVDDGAALGDEGDVAGFRGLVDVGGVDALGGDDQAEAVRADDPRAVTLCDLHDPILECFSSLAHLLEPGGDDDHHGDAFLPALLDDARDVLGRDGDDRHIDGVRNIEDGWIRFESLNLRAFVVHRVELSGEVEEVVHHGVTHLLGFGRGPDDRDRPGGVILDRHEGPLFRHLLDRLIVDEDTGVDDAGSRLVQPDRVDVELHDVHVLGEETVDRPYDLDERLFVSRP